MACYMCRLRTGCVSRETSGNGHAATAVSVSLFACSGSETPGRAEQVGAEAEDATPTHESLMRRAAQLWTNKLQSQGSRLKRELEQE